MIFGNVSIYSSDEKNKNEKYVYLSILELFFII